MSNCYARVNSDEALEFAHPERAGLDHEPLLDEAGASVAVVVWICADAIGRHAPSIEILGAKHWWCICRHCLALVLIPESELQR